MAETKIASSSTGGFVKTFIRSTALWLVVFMACAPAVRSQTQEIEGYTVIKGQTTSIVCLGRWVPSKEVGKPGVCEGQLVDVAQLTAISSKLTAERLDQILLFLSSIDQKLADSNNQLERLIEATANVQAAIDRQAGQSDELLRDAIDKRFDELTRGLLAGDAFRKELEGQKKEILKEITKGNLKEKTPPSQ